MEGIGSEVSQKIRAAIKAKLIELGAYVDDELPDYIMVMVANKRTKAQMDEDLQLFLSSNTKLFTTWLHTVLQKLQEVTVASFENKKESEKKKSKRKKSDTDSESRKSTDEDAGKGKKHSKKHKDSKKSKKSKHKSKEKAKSKSDKGDSKDDGKVKGSLEIKASQSSEPGVGNNSAKSQKLQLNEAVGKAILGNLKKSDRNDGDDFLNVSTFLNDQSTELKVRDEKDNLDAKDSASKSGKTEPVLKTSTEHELEGTTVDENKKKQELIEDEFNIEPLKPVEKDAELLLLHDEPVPQTGSEVQSSQADKAGVSAPTEELLREHNKMLSEKSQVGTDERDGNKKTAVSDSEDSVSPEEMRKQLLLSRAKKKLENSKLAERMRSNSPDVLILEETSRILPKDYDLTPRLGSGKRGEHGPSKPHSDTRNRGSSSPVDRRKYSPSTRSFDSRKSFSPETSPYRKRNVDQRVKHVDERKRPTASTVRNSTSDRETEKKQPHSDDRDKRKNVIKISESIAMEKNLGVKRESEKGKDKDRGSTSKKKSISSRVVTITGPEAPEISSIVKVKPREYIAKDKQANKALILKAVADAEKSIATVHTRTEPELKTEPKKEALFTKNLREKRFEKLAVTLSNIRKSPDLRERIGSRADSRVDSEKSDKSRTKVDSSDLTLRKISKSDDQFISSKTTITEKNEKYIRCWLEGVERAVKDDEMVNPIDMEDLVIQSNFTDEENDCDGDDAKKANEAKKRKKSNDNDGPGEKSAKNQRLTEKEIANLRMIPNAKTNFDGPQIVVTLDGLDSKTIKDIILRNKESVNGPILSTGRRGSGEVREGVKAPAKKSVTKAGYEKISDRFGRLNRANDEDEEDEDDLDEDDDDDESDKSRGDNKNFDKETRDKGGKESKNKQLIAQLSEKFGKVDREFENKRKRYPEEDRRYIYNARKTERDEGERNGKYRKLDRRSNREASSPPPTSKYSSASSAQICKFYPGCKNVDCRYFHPKKCRFDEDCTNSNCKYVHSDSTPGRSSKKFKWYSKS